METLRLLVDNKECIRPVHRNGSRIVTEITEFNYNPTKRDEIIGYCERSFSHYPITDDHMVLYPREVS